MINVYGHSIYGAYAAPQSVAVSSYWRVSSGYYNGTSSSLPITGLGFQPQLLIIKGSGSTANQDPVITWRGMSDSSGNTNATTVINPSTKPATGIVETFDSDGFTIGTSVLVNETGRRYFWTAWAGGDAQTAYGNYIGTGSSFQPVSGLTFQPRFLFLRKRDTTAYTILALENNVSGRAVRLSDIGFASNIISSLDADGATVGTSTASNDSGFTYDWIAFAPPSSACTISAYTGNGGGSQTITGLAFSPQVVFLKGDSNATPVFRGSAHTGTFSTILSDSTAHGGQRITAINSSGFTVGNNANVNFLGVNYYYIAMTNG